MQIVWHLPVSSSGWANIEKGLSLSKVLSCGGFWPQSKNKSLFQKLSVKSQVLLWVCVCVCVCMCVWARAQPRSHVWLFATPWTVASQAPLSMGFSRQESWSGVPFPIPGDLPNPGIEPTSPAFSALAADSSPLCCMAFCKRILWEHLESQLLHPMCWLPYVHCQAMRCKDRTFGSYSKLLTSC